MTIAITGATGFIGTHLVKKLSQSGHQVVVLPRNPAPEEYLSCDAIIHLAGAPLAGRWTPEYKQEILSSRVDTARALIEAVQKAGRGPKVFISASAIGFYGDGGEAELTEESPAGQGFLADVCAQWEEVAASAQAAGMRWVSVRTGVVLGAGGGILAQLLPTFKWGVGGSLGSGNQWFSWIYSQDLVRVYETVLLDDSFTGPINAVSPHPVRYKDFSNALAKALHRPAFFSVPAALVRLVLGESASVVLSSQKVIPKKLLQRNFVFSQPDIEGALQRSIE